MSRRVAKVNVHVVTPEGVTVLSAGDIIPDELRDYVGSHAYETLRVEGDGDGAEALEAKAKADLAKAEADRAEAERKAEEAERAAAQEREDAAKKAAETPSEPDTPLEDRNAPPAAPDAGYDASTEPEHPAPYADRSYRSLQAAAKARDLKGDGDTATLVARLEADDRDRANQ